MKRTGYDRNRTEQNRTGVQTDRPLTINKSSLACHKLMSVFIPSSGLGQGWLWLWLFVG